MNMGDFRDGILSFRATPWRKFIGMFESVARRIKSAGRPLSSVRSSSSIKPAPTILPPSERLFSAFMDNLPGFVWMKDVDGRYVYVNERVKRLAPYQNGWLGKTDAEIWPTEIAATFRKNDLKVAASRERLETVERCHLEGQELWVLVNKFPIFNDTGSVVMVGGAGVDITERKRAEKALRETEEKYRSIFENAVEGVFQTTPDGRFVAANPALARMLGFDSPEELISTRTDIAQEHYVDPKSREEFKRSMEENRFVLDFERETYRKDGSKIWISENVRAVRDHGGTVLYYEGTTQDITGKKRAEEALRESEERYRDLVENSNDLICTHNLDGLILSANRAAMDLMGYSSGSYSGGTNFREILAPEVRDQFDEYLRRIRADGVARGLMLVQTKTGEKRIWEYHNTLRTQGVSAPIVRGVARDITERRLANHSLGLFRTLIDQSTDAIEVIDQNTMRFLDCNKSAYQDLGYSREEFLALSVYDIDPLVDERMIAQLAEEMDRSGFVIFESIHRRKDGSTFPVEINAKNIRLERDYRLAVVRDITERKRAEEALQESEERFRQLSEAAFEAIILHDQGTILEVNQSFCRMYGYERAEVIGKSVLDLALPEFREQLLQTVRSRETSPYEGPALRKDGTVFKAEVAGKPIHYQGRVVRVAAIRDITEQKRNERRQAAQYAVTRVLAESATLAGAIPQLLKVICESLRWKMGEFWRICDNTNLLRRLDTWHVPGLDATAFIEASRQTELAPGVGLPGRVWQSGQPAWVSDVMTDPGFARAAIADKLGLRGAVAFPISLEINTLGVMLFFSRRTPEVDEELLKMMSAIGSQIGQFTERKQAEEALLASERKYRDIFVFAPVGIYQALRDGTLITANQTLAEMMGYASVDELLRVNLGRAVYLVDGERERLIREHEVRGYQVDLELQWKTKDGSPIWVQLTAHAIKGANGATEYWEGFVRDITELKRAEGALRQTEQQYESLVHSIDGIVWEVDPQTFRFTFVSKEAERLLGYPLAQWLNEPNFWADHTHPDDRKWAVDFCLKATATKENHQFEYRMIAVDGRVVWLKDNVTVSVMDDKSVRLRGVMMDITERKRAEEKLQNSEKYFRSLIENASDLITIADGNGIIRYESPSLERMLGYKPEERIGRSVLDLVHLDDLPAAKRHFAEGIRNPGIVHLMECRFQHKGGSWHLLETRGINLLDDPVVAGIVVNSRDITERKRAEEALQSYPRRLIEAQEAERQHIARELHDQIGQVLTAVRINLHTIGNSCETAESRSLISQGMALIDGALEQVRNLSFELRPSFLDDLGLVAALRWYSDQYTQRTGIRTRSVTNLPERQSRLKQELETACFRIVQEALTNVVRHAQARNVLIDLSKLDHKIVLSIKDDGIGFDKLSPNGGASAIRLGLTGMKERALALGGTLEIESAPAQGTEIRAWFPTSSNED